MSPNEAWLTAVLGQLGSFIPIPPKGIVPLSVPAGPNSHGNHPPEDQNTNSTIPQTEDEDGDEEPYYTGIEDDERVARVTQKNNAMEENVAFPDMDRDELETLFGFDRKKFDDEEVKMRRRRQRRLIPYGGVTKYI